MANNPNPIVKGPQVGADPIAAQQGISGETRLTANSVYSGVVALTDTVSRTLSVIVNKARLDNCIYAAESLASLMGFSNTGLPPVGTSVVVLYTPAQTFVLSTAPTLSGHTDDFSGVIGGDIKRSTADNKAFTVKHTGSTAATSPGYAAPKDLVPGEVDWQNNMGIAMRLLFNFAQLSAGDTALVETHLTNEMVRIVSNYFVHHSVGGDELIWNNGRCNHEEHFTSYPHEAEGKIKPDDEFAKKVGEGVYDVEGSVEDPYNHTGRWRVSTYTGFLGDMIHRMVTDPTSMASSIAKDGAMRAGKFKEWVGSDGNWVVQAAGGIHIELAPKILVPAMTEAWNHPDSTVAEKLDKLNKDFLKLWGKGPNWEDLTTACWQMRNYAKYLTIYHSIARFKQMEEAGACKIPTEKDAPAPSPTAGEKDKQEANPEGSTPYQGSASITIDPSGSITIVSNSGTSIIINQNNLQICAPNNFEIQAGNMLTLSAKHVSIKGLLHTEIVSVLGPLVNKARTALTHYCELGRVWIKGDAKIPAEENKKLAEEHWPFAEDSKLKPIIPEMGGFGVVIDGTQSPVLLHGARGVLVTTSEEKSDVLVQAPRTDSNVRVFARRKVIIRAAWDCLISAANNIGLRSLRTAIKSQVVQLGQAARIIGTNLDVGGMIRTGMLACLNAIVNKTGSVAKYSDPAPVTPVTSDEHLFQLGEDLKAVTDKGMEDTFMEYELNKYAWSFVNWGPDKELTSPLSLKAPIMNDTLSLGANENFVECDWSKCTLIPGLPRTQAKSQPWPGAGAQYFVFDKQDTPAVGSIWEEHFTTSHIASASDMKLKPYKIYVRQ